MAPAGAILIEASAIRGTSSRFVSRVVPRQRSRSRAGARGSQTRSYGCPARTRPATHADRVRATHDGPRDPRAPARDRDRCRRDVVPMRDKGPSSWLEPRDCALFLGCISTVPARREPLGAGACAAVGAARAAGDGWSWVDRPSPAVPRARPTRLAAPEARAQRLTPRRTQRDSHNAQRNRCGDSGERVGPDVHRPTERIGAFDGAHRR